MHPMHRLRMERGFPPLVQEPAPQIFTESFFIVLVQSVIIAIVTEAAVRAVFGGRY